MLENTILILSMFFLPVFVSGVYFLASRDENKARRLVSSVHGVVLMFAAIYSWLASFYTTIAEHGFELLVFQTLLLIGIFFSFYSIFTFRGPRVVHLTQVGNVISLLVIWFVGAMSITHDWV